MKTSIKVSILALSLLGFGQGANADTHQLGVMNDYDAKDFGSSFVANTTFDDSWFFTLGGQSNVVSDVHARFSSPTIQNFLQFEAKLLDSGSNIIADYSPTYSANLKRLDGDIDVAGLSAGTYSIHVKGLTANTFSTAYAGTISVSPVPEPEEWAMMILGLGLVGMQLLRKNSVQDTEVMYG